MAVYTRNLFKRLVSNNEVVGIYVCYQKVTIEISRAHKNERGLGVIDMHRTY